MRITDIRVRHAPRSIWGHLAEREKTLPLVTPLDIYPEYAETRGSWFWDSAMAVVEIETSDGVVGRGWCEDGVGAVSGVVERHLRNLLMGAPASETEGLWDRMYRATLPYGRKGIALQAISAIDIALWDVCAKALERPVYELLGGPVHPDVPVYASALHPVGADLVVEEAQAYVAEGYQAMKARFPYGPGNGVEGMAANEAHVASIRDAVGPDIEIMFDAYMGWDFNYAKKMCRRLEPYNLAWIEEPFVPDDLTSYAKLRRETNIPISGGEHEYTRYGFADIIEREAMDILQPDLRRCGGFTEGAKIAALAQAAGLTVIPHAYGAVHIHFALGTANVPMVEYFPMPVWDSLPESEQVPIFIGEPQPSGGRVTASDRPGLGVEVNEVIFT